MALSLSPDKAAGLRTVFTVLGVVMLVTIPLVFLIPDRARERLEADARAESEPVSRLARFLRVAPPALPNWPPTNSWLPTRNKAFTLPSTPFPISP